MEDKGKVLYTSSSASPQSGAYRKLLQMREGMREQGWETFLVLPERNLEESKFTEGEMYYLPLPSVRLGMGLGSYIKFLFSNLAAVVRLIRIIRKEKVDIVHVNEVYDLYGGLAAKCTYARCVWHVRAEFSDWGFAHWFLPRIVHRLADRIVVVSKSVKEKVFSNQGLGTKKVMVVYDQGPDSAIFHPQINSGKIRDEFNLQVQKNVVTMIGKLTQRKGHETFVRAAARVLKAFPEAVFFLVGGALDAPHHQAYARRLQRLPASLGIEDQVRFTGYRPDVAEIMAVSDVIVHCSLYPDPFPGVVLQAMAVGKAVVASSIGGPREQIEEGVSGVLIEPGDPKRLAEAIRSLLSDGEKRSALGREAAKKVKRDFKPEIFYNQMDDLYRFLMRVER